MVDQLCWVIVWTILTNGTWRCSLICLTACSPGYMLQTTLRRWPILAVPAADESCPQIHNQWRAFRSVFCSVSVWTMHACRTKNFCWLLCCYVMQSDYLRNFQSIYYCLGLISINILMIDIFTTDKLLANCSMCLVFKSISRMCSPSTCSADRELWVMHSARSSAWQTMFSKFKHSAAFFQMIWV